MPIKLPSFRPRKDAYPPDLWTKCPSCSEMLFNKQLDKSDRICPTCGHHFRLSAEARLALLLDDRSFREEDAGLQSVDALGFVDQKPYPDRLAAAQMATGLRDAAVRGTGLIDGHPVAICVMDFGFMGGSMGAVVGEKVTRAAEQALADRLPLVIVSASGGARMQEGTLALMQLAKTCGALERLRAAGVPYISVMSDPTTGGVFASYAVLGDVNLAEPNALIGFAGARVQAGTIAQELPPGFQRAEFLFDHGFIDRVVHRRELRSEIALLLRYLVPGDGVDEPPESRPGFTIDPIGFLTSLAEKVVPDLGPLDDAPAPNGGGGGAEAGAANGSARSTRLGRPSTAPTRRAAGRPRATTVEGEATDG
ncbi:MAG: acetyl-CoA carboxylase carboxyltransferase subunit beta [Chloroflexi bacterium]|nr:acetyl-CoA carboxylase carboxyltransferase subunit beta [Chloroflexota bacterium]